MRVYVLYLALLVLSAAGLRDWFISYCGLIVLTAFMERHDMPKTIGGISGLNPWNMLLVVTFFHWFTQRRAAGHKWDLPRRPTLLLVGYVLCIVIGYIRAAIDIDSFARGSMTLSSSDGRTMRMNYTIGGLLIDELVNPLRYMVPALLFYDGARSRQRIRWGLAAILIMGAWYAFFVDKTMPIGVLTGQLDPTQSRKRLQRELGLHANDMAFVLIFIFYGMVAAWPIMKTALAKAGCLLGSLMTFLGIALCQSRGGFIGFTVVGIALTAIRKPKLLLVLPFIFAAIPLALPGIVDRMTMGMDAQEVDPNSTEDFTAGRLTHLWPPTLEWIAKSPLWGYGRYIMLRDPALFRRILFTEGAVPSHPHNAYLEVSLDYGLIALFIVLMIFIGILKIAYNQMRSGQDPFVRVVGTMAFAAALDNMVVGISSRALLPRPSMMGMWCIFALSARIWVLQQQAAQKRQRRRSGIPPPLPSLVPAHGAPHAD